MNSIKSEIQVSLEHISNVIKDTDSCHNTSVDLEKNIRNLRDTILDGTDEIRRKAE